MPPTSARVFVMVAASAGSTGAPRPPGPPGSTWILPGGAAPNCSPIGTLMLKKGSAGFFALNSMPPGKTRLSAVLATKELMLISLAPGPKIMPLGLSRKRSAVPPIILRLPKMSLGSVPVTRPRMRVNPFQFLKVTVAPVATLNLEKLWKRLGPDDVPPSMRQLPEQTFPGPGRRIVVGVVPSTTISSQSFSLCASRLIRSHPRPRSRPRFR